MTTFRWSAYGTLQTYLSTDLNSLANDGTYLGAEIDNTTNRHKYMRLMINLAAVDLSSETSPAVRIRFIESIDGGTTYEDDDDTAWAITLPLEKGTGSQAHYRAGVIEIPPGHFKLMVVNETGAAFAATGNTLKYVTYTEEDNS